MKFLAILLLCSFTVVMVAAFPDRYSTIANLPSGSHNVNSISASDDGGPNPSGTESDEGIRQPRGLLKKIFGYPKSVVVVEKVYVPQNPGYGYGYGYGSSYKGYGRRY